MYPVRNSSSIQSVPVPSVEGSVHSGLVALPEADIISLLRAAYWEALSILGRRVAFCTARLAEKESWPLPSRPLRVVIMMTPLAPRDP